MHCNPLLIPNQTAVGNRSSRYLTPIFKKKKKEETVSLTILIILFFRAIYIFSLAVRLLFFACEDAGKVSVMRSSASGQLEIANKLSCRFVCKRPWKVLKYFSARVIFGMQFRFNVIRLG